MVRISSIYHHVACFVMFAELKYNDNNNGAQFEMKDRCEMYYLRGRRRTMVNSDINSSTARRQLNGARIVLSLVTSGKDTRVPLDGVSLMQDVPFNLPPASWPLFSPSNTFSTREFTHL